MSKNKLKKINKETRRLIESISDMVRVRKRDNTLRFKGIKKKTVREVKRSCPHWIFRKGKVTPAVEKSPDNPKFVRCRICGKQFPIAPLEIADYRTACESFEALVDQLYFYSVKMGGDPSDTKLFVQLKKLVPKVAKVAKNEIRELNKHDEESKRQALMTNSSNFDAYSGSEYK